MRHMINDITKPLAALMATGCMLAAGASTAAAQITLPADIEELPLWSMKLMVHTCDSANADSDGDLFTRWTGITTPSVYLDHPGDDRKRNGWDEWSVTPTDVTRVKDIRRIQFETTSNDGWCVDRIALYVNDSPYPLFSRTISGGVWIDTDTSSTYKIFYQELRDNTWWTAEGTGLYQCRIPTYLANATLDEKIEGTMGDMMSDPASPKDARKLYWGDGSVSISRRNDSSVRMTAKSYYEINNFADPKVTATSNITIGCGFDAAKNKNVLRITPSKPSVDVDFPWYIDALTLGLIDVVANAFVADSVPSISKAITTETPLCPQSILVNSFGSVELDWGDVLGVPIESFEGALCVDPASQAQLCALLPALPMCS